MPYGQLIEVTNSQLISLFTIHNSQFTILMIHTGPAFGDAVGTCGPFGLGGGGEGARGADAMEPVAEAARGGDVGGQAGHGAEVGAVEEHSVVAVSGQRRGGQLGGRRQGAAAVEHVLVAVVGQRRGRQQQLARVGKGGVSVEKTLEGVVAQRGGRREVLLVHEAHDVAIDLHLRRAAGNLGVVVGGDAGAVAVEGHLVARGHVDGRRRVHGRLGPAVQRVLHTALRAVHHDGAGGEGLHGQGHTLEVINLHDTDALDAVLHRIGGYKLDAFGLVDFEPAHLRVTAVVGLQRLRHAGHLHRPVRRDAVQLVLLRRRRLGLRRRAAGGVRVVVELDGLQLDELVAASHRHVEHELVVGIRPLDAGARRDVNVTVRREVHTLRFDNVVEGGVARHNHRDRVDGDVGGVAEVEVHLRDGLVQRAFTVDIAVDGVEVLAADAPGVHRCVARHLPGDAALGDFARLVVGVATAGQGAVERVEQLFAVRLCPCGPRGSRRYGQQCHATHKKCPHDVFKIWFNIILIK